MFKAKDNSAFTIPEVFLVIILIAVWAAVVLPRFGSSNLFSNSRLKTTAYNVTSDIRYTRSLAISKTKTHIIYFDQANRVYKIYQNSVAPENQIGETKQISTQINWSVPQEIDFSSLGSATSSGGLTLTLSSGPGQYQITVIPATGAVLLEKL